MGLFHKHQYKEFIGGIWSDEENGPRSCHEIWWECSCGSVLDSKAKARDLWARRKNVVAIIPERVIYADR